MTEISAKDVKRFLKRVAARYDNGSPFSVPRENEIDAERKLGRLQITTSKRTGEIIGVIQGRLDSKPRKAYDFARRTFRFPARTLSIKNMWFDCEPGHAVDELSKFAERFPTADSIRVRTYAENDALRRALETVGFSRVMSKVSAFAEVLAFYSNDPSLVVAESEIDVVEDASLLEIEPNFFSDYPVANLVKKVNDLGSFANHYSIYNKDGKWSGFSIRGFKRDDPLFIEKPSEMSKRWKRNNAHLLDLKCEDTVIAEAFRDTLDYLSEELGALERVRILRLGGRGRIERHCDIQDVEAGLADGMIARFHVPLVTNEQSIFTSWQLDGSVRTMHMPKASLCYLDHRKPHAVVNTSDETRIHLLVDVHSNERVRNLIRRAYENQK